MAGNNPGAEAGVMNAQTQDGMVLNLSENPIVTGQGTGAEELSAATADDNMPDADADATLLKTDSQQKMQLPDLESELMRLLSKESLQTQDGAEQLNKSLFDIPSVKNQLHHYYDCECDLPLNALMNVVLASPYVPYSAA